MFTADDLLDQESSAAENLVGPFARRECTSIFGAHGGHGKTTMSTRIVDAFVGEKEFLGYRGMGGTAIVFDLEQNMTSAQRQLMQAVYPGKWEKSTPVKDIVAELPRSDYGANLIYALWPGGVDLTHPGVDFDTLGEIIDKADADLVMLDPVYKLMMGSPSKESETIEGFINLWGKLRSALGFATLLPMHPRKPPAQGGGSLTMHDLYGHAHWGWWGEQIFMLKRTPGSNGAILRIEKDRESELTMGEEWTLAYNETTGYERLASDISPDGSSLPSWERVWRQLQEVPVSTLLTRQQIGNMLLMPDKTVRVATERLERLHDGGKYPGLIVEAGPNRIKLYGFQPDSKRHEIEEMLNREFGEVEEE